MRKSNALYDALNAVFLVMPILCAMALWDRIPDPMPIHFDVSGQPDGWSAKSIYVFLLPVVINFFVSLILRVIVFVDRRLYAEPLAHRAFGILRVGISLMVGVIGCMMVVTTFERDFPAMQVIFSLVLTFLGVLGYISKDLPRNTLIGVRTSATMSSDEYWSDFHRRMGPRIIGVSVCGAAGLWLVPDVAVPFVFLALVLAGATTLVVASFRGRPR